MSIEKINSLAFFDEITKYFDNAIVGIPQQYTPFVSVLSTSDGTFYLLFASKSINQNEVEYFNLQQTVRSFSKNQDGFLKFKVIECEIDVIKNAQGKAALNDIVDVHTDNASIEEFDDMLLDAYRLKASDIHITCTTKKSNIKFRINGDLEFYKPQAHYESLMAFCSVFYSFLSAVDGDISEKSFNAAKQLDGVVYRNIEGMRLGARISSHSTDQTKDNFYMVLRFLGDQNSYVSRVPLNKLGFIFNQHLKIIKSTKGRGISLIIGETNSGKSFTQGNILLELLEQTGGRKSILSVENPIERLLEGIIQFSITPKGNMKNHSLSELLKKFSKFVMRADPNIIAVGEIRDIITVNTAMDLALSGHSIFSTMHCDSPFDVFDRMIALGANESILGSSNSVLRSVISQKLFQKLCPKCSLDYKSVSLSNSRMQVFDEFCALGLEDSIPNIRFRNSNNSNCTCRKGLIGQELVAEVLTFCPDIIDNLKNCDKVSAERIWLEQGNYSRQDVSISKISRGLIDPTQVIHEFGDLTSTFKKRINHNIIQKTDKFIGEYNV